MRPRAAHRYPPGRSPHKGTRQYVAALGQPLPAAPARLRYAACVSTRGPFSVIAIVCSKWAEREPSTVTIVHLSGSVRVAGPPALTIGSIASVSPGTSFTPRFGLP